MFTSICARKTEFIVEHLLKRRQMFLYAHFYRIKQVCLLANVQEKVSIQNSVSSLVDSSGCMFISMGYS